MEQLETQLIAPGTDSGIFTIKMNPADLGTGILTQLQSTSTSGLTYSSGYVSTAGTANYALPSFSNMGDYLKLIESNPIEKEIFPFRDFLVGKDKENSSRYELKSIKSYGTLDSTLYYLNMLGVDKPGITPEQLLVVASDYVESNYSEEDNNSKQAVKHMRIALAYLEKGTMESFKNKK